MMDSIWSILGMDPTQDISAIKRAYAQKSRTCHPEENPEGFLRLREAYRAALDYAEGNTDASPEPQEAPSESDDGETEDQGWTFSGKPVVWDEGPNPYADHEAIHKFLDLYTGKQRKDTKKWLDYFTSDAFLDAGWDWRFTALLMEHVIRLEAEHPVNREFLNWLYIVYQFKAIRKVYRDWNGDNEQVVVQFQMHREGQFDGQEFIFEIAARGPVPKQPKGNELALFYSFMEYRSLCRTAEDGVWSEEDIGRFSEIIGHYAAGYITDKCQQRGDMDCERHPAGLRLITHFFRREGLPEELYRIAWQKLDLRTAIMGRAKIHYGVMRELVLARLPELAGEQKVSYANLRTEFHNYAVSTYKKSGENAQATAEDVQRTDAFFDREDFQKALLDRRFVEEEILRTWVEETRCDYYLNRIIQFYKANETAPCAQRVIDRAREMLKYQALADRLREDRETTVQEGEPTLRSASFFRHWLNTGFYRTQDRESGRSILEYLNKELPFLPEWSKEFLEVEDGEVPVPVPVEYVLDGDAVEVHFHLRYMSFHINGEQVYRSCLPWERVAALADADEFFFLLPIAVAAYDQYKTVRAEILRRLTDTAAPEDSRTFIAGCLADQVCGMPQPDAVSRTPKRDVEELETRPLPPESALPFEVFAEDADQLFVCVWFQQEQVLALYQQTAYGRYAVRDGRYGEVADALSAVALARQLMQDQLSPTNFPMEKLEVLPEAVYAGWDYAAISRESRERDRELPPGWSARVELLGEAVTSEKLGKLLTQFAAGRVQRMEWSWRASIPVGEEQGYEPRRSLVFLKDKAGYACLYFDDFRAESYALLELPEVYGKIERRSELVPFGKSKLFDESIHQSFSTIRRRLDVVFRQVSWPNSVKPNGLWTYAEYVFHGRVKYDLDKQLLGGFPMEWAYNRADMPFYFSLYPDSAACVDAEGSMEALTVSDLERPRLQQMLARFLQGGFQKLRLTWGKAPGKRSHIVLLRDGGRFLMAWILEEKQTVEYHAADRWAYMRVEGKKYAKDTFQGRVTPAYLIHSGVIPLRNALELLLACIDKPAAVTEEVGEYAKENPVKPRPYETQWAELVGDTFGA